MRRREHQSGFGTAVILVVVLVVAALAISGFLIYQRSHKPSTGKNSAATSQTQTTSQSQSTTTAQTQQSTAQPVYNNTKYGFSFSYPSNWRVEQGDPASSVDEQHTELVLWLVDTNAPTAQDHTAYIEVSSRDLSSKTAIIDNSIDSEGGKSANYKQSLTLQGKETVKYTIPQSATVNRVMYFISVGTKTYSVQTIHEANSITRNPGYMNQFNALVNSWRLP